MSLLLVQFKCNLICNPLTENSIGDDSSFVHEESDNIIFDRSDNTAATNSDVESNDVNKLKTDAVALKMFVTEQFYIIKQSGSSPKTSVYNCSTRYNIYIDSLLKQIHYLKEGNKMKNSIIQSLLWYRPSKNINDYNDKGDNISPISKMAENDNLSNHPHNRFNRALNNNFVDTKVSDPVKDEGSSKSLEHNNVKKEKKKKKKNHSEKLYNSMT